MRKCGHRWNVRPICWDGLAEKFLEWYVCVFSVKINRLLCIRHFAMKGMLLRKPLLFHSMFILIRADGIKWPA